jgi:hypothetical protein
MSSHRLARRGVRHGLAGLVLFALTALSAAQDGPYVVRADDGGWLALSVAPSDAGPQKREQALGSQAEITVPGVGSLPDFRVALREPAAVARDDIKVAVKAPLFVVADTHGEYEILVSQLQKHGIIDAKLAWKFGRGHLVVLGDVFDRGPNQTEILWLLYKLEAEATQAGGGSHLLLGNHETMILRGDQRYLHPRYAETTRALGVASYSELFGPETLAGQWLRSRPTMLRINGQLFLHGGVSRALADSGLSIAQVNSGVRALLTGSTPATDAERRRAELLLGPLGPLWYRGYFANQSSFPAADEEDIARVLAVFGVRRIFIGHTMVPTITSLYGGKVIAVQVYPKRDEDGVIHFESVLVRAGELWRANLQELKRMDIPALP